MRSKDPTKLEIWIADVRLSGFSVLRRFAQILERDIDAVRNAISDEWSNGQTEGQINKLKALKRSMYGHAGAELLRARMPPPNA
ncbi:transposase [Acidisoma silvae]